MNRKTTIDHNCDIMITPPAGMDALGVWEFCVRDHTVFNGTPWNVAPSSKSRLHGWVQEFVEITDLDCLSNSRTHAILFSALCSAYDQSTSVFISVKYIKFHCF